MRSETSAQTTVRTTKARAKTVDRTTIGKLAVRRVTAQKCTGGPHGVQPRPDAGVNDSNQLTAPRIGPAGAPVTTTLDESIPWGRKPPLMTMLVSELERRPVISAVPRVEAPATLGYVSRRFVACHRRTRPSLRNDLDPFK